MLASAFVAAVRRQGILPANFTSADILAMGDAEIASIFVPLLERMRQNYFVREATITADARNKFAIPQRAIAGGFRSVQLALGNGWVPVPQIDPTEADYVTAGPWPTGYVLDGGSIKLYPTGTTGTLRVQYAARPSAMVDETDSTKTKAITSVTPGPSTTTIICGGYVGSTIIDIVSGGPTHHLKAINATLTASTLVNTSELLDGIVAGTIPGSFDCVCFPGYTPFVPLPEELSAALVHRTAGVILRSLGYDEEAQQQLAVAGECIDACVPMLMPRNEGNPKTVRGGLRSAIGRGIRHSRWF